jgi:iron complex outermembrane receptor protein
VQLALRYENFSDVGSTTVGKIAAGWQVFEALQIRGSYSTAFRAPNLVTINEQMVARNNTRDDWTCHFADDFGGSPGTLDCSNSVQRVATGSKTLQPETSKNFNIGLVITPLEDLMFTIDYWSIEKEETIGLFGEENHTLLDLIMRREAGTADCANFQGNPAINRDDLSSLDQEELDIYATAGICPAGQSLQISDQYANLDTRTVEGIDIGIYYTLDSGIGLFDFRYVGSFLQRYEQQPGDLANVLLEAQADGTIPAGYPVSGFDDLIGQDGNQEDRQSLSASWRLNNFGAALSAYRVGEFYDNRVTLTAADGTPTRYYVPAMTTLNGTADYTFRWRDSSSLRGRLGVKNMTGERAPLTSDYFSYSSDAHRDLGRYYYLDLRLQF